MITHCSALTVADCSTRRIRLQGFSIVELMVAMVIGLVVLLGVMGVMSANRQNYRVTEALSEMQENARLGVELMARDMRQAGNYGCAQSLDNPTTEATLGTGWWQTWNPVVGFDGETATPAVAFGSGAGARIDDTHAIQLQGVEDGWPILNLVPVNTGTGPSSITTLAGDKALAANDVVLLCNTSGPPNPHITVLQNTPGAGTTLTVPALTRAYQVNGQVARYTATTWYIGDNNRPEDGGRSLYRVRYIQGSAAAPTNASRLVVEEILPGVTDMQFRYLQTGSDDFLTADEVGAAGWPTVVGVEITLSMTSTAANVADSSGTNAEKRIERAFVSVVALRNR